MAKYKDWLTDEGLVKIEGWAKDGLTDEQISYNMGVGYSTFRAWKSKIRGFSSSFKKGKEVVDRQVENALLKRALGYTYDEITFKDDIEVKRVRKQVVPDTTAQIFWLKNRKPNDWRDRREIKTDDNDQVMEFIAAMKSHDKSK